MDPAAATVVRYELTVEGYREMVAHVGVKWSAFVGVDETKSLLLLKLDPSAACAVPKRAFADAEELARFRREAEQRIGTAAVDRTVADRSLQLHS